MTEYEKKARELYNSLDVDAMEQADHPGPQVAESNIAIIAAALDEAFDDGVTHALTLVGKHFGVSPITIADGSEDYDGDVSGTIAGIISEGCGEDMSDAIIETVRARGETND